MEDASLPADLRDPIAFWDGSNWVKVINRARKIHMVRDWPMSMPEREINDDRILRETSLYSFTAAKNGVMFATLDYFMIRFLSTPAMVEAVKEKLYKYKPNLVIMVNKINNN